MMERAQHVVLDMQWLSLNHQTYGNLQELPSNSSGTEKSNQQSQNVIASPQQLEISYSTSSDLSTDRS